MIEPASDILYHHNTSVVEAQQSAIKIAFKNKAIDICFTKRQYLPSVLTENQRVKYAGSP